MTPALLKSARAQLGLTQLQAGALIGAPQRTWQSWEHGQRGMPEQLWRLWRHCAGIEQIPFSPRPYHGETSTA